MTLNITTTQLILQQCLFRLCCTTINAFSVQLFPVCTSLAALVPLVAFVFEESGHH